MTKLPSSASVAHTAGGAKLNAPSALRNLPAVVDLLRAHAPETGRALEIASGTGQHITALAQALPAIEWHPTELSPDRIDSINAYATEADLSNLHPAKTLDAAQSGWASHHMPYDLVYLGNLLHLVHDAAARTIIEEAALSLKVSGAAIFYGPFKRNGALTSEGDARFDAQLREANPAIGYKDDRWVEEILTGCGLRVTVVPMPANNLAFIARQDLT